MLRYFPKIFLTLNAPGSCLSSLRYRNSTEKRDRLLSLIEQFPEMQMKYSKQTGIRMFRTIQLTAMSPQFLDDPTARLDQIHVNQFYQQIASVIHQISLSTLNVLLAGMKARGDMYDSKVSVHRSISKNLKSYSMNFNEPNEPNELPKTLKYLADLKYPNAVREALLTIITTESDKAKSFLKKMSANTFLRIIIFAFEERQISMGVCKAFVEKLKGRDVKELRDLVLLYHFTQIIESCLKLKTHYQVKKEISKKVIFNPYEESTSVQKNSEPQLGYVDPALNPDNISRILELQKREILNISRQAISRNVLEDCIVKLIEADLQEVRRADLLLICTINRLTSFVDVYITKSMQTLNHIEFVTLSRAGSPQFLMSNLHKFMGLMEEILSVGQKAYIFLELNKHAQVPITANMILDLLKKGEHLNYETFLAITRMVEKIKEQEKTEIPRILDRLKQLLKD